MMVCNRERDVQEIMVDVADERMSGQGKRGKGG